MTSARVLTCQVHSSRDSATVSNLLGSDEHLLVIVTLAGLRRVWLHRKFEVTGCNAALYACLCPRGLGSILIGTLLVGGQDTRKAGPIRHTTSPCTR